MNYEATVIARVDPRLKRALIAQAHRERKDVSQLVREAIDLLLTTRTRDETRAVEHDSNA